MEGSTRVFCLLGAFLLSLPVTAQQPQDKSQQASIEGATLTKDGQPLRKTNLTLRPLPTLPAGGGIGAAGGGPLQQPPPYGATSDAAGKFSFTGLEPGRYQLLAEHPGYLRTNYGTKRSASGIQSGNPLITLTAGQHMTGADIQLNPQATISGKVTDEDGDPMPRLRVTVVRRMYMAGGARLMSQGGNQTDDNGEYHLSDLETGRYYVSFSPQLTGPMQQGVRRTGADAAGPEMGYGTVYYPGVGDLESAVALDLVEGQDKGGINVRMRKVPVFHVRGTAGGALPPPDPSLPLGMASRTQISVAPAGEAGGAPLAMGLHMLNPDGTFDVGGLTPGTYNVTLVKTPGMIQPLGQTTVVVSNRDLSDVSLTAKAPVDISGTVKIVPEGATVAPPAASPQGGQQASGGQQANGKQQAGAQSQPTALARVNRISLQPAEIGLGGGNVQPATVQDDGSFVLKGVPAVRYRVNIPVQGNGYLKSATFNGQDVLGAAVDMSGGGTLSIVVSMTAAEIDGNVTNADGQPAGGVTVVIVPDPLQPGRSDLYRQPMSRSDGGFTVRAIPPGKYRVLAFEEIEPGAYLDPDYIKPFESLGASVTVEDNDKKTVTVAQISKAKSEETLRRAGR